MSGEILGFADTENTIQAKNGTERLIAWHNTLLKDDDGQIIGTLSSGEDITDRKRFEEALRRERDLIARIAETSPVGIIVVDRDGQITFANPRAATVMGVTRDELVSSRYNAPAWRLTDYGGQPLPDRRMPYRLVIENQKPVFDLRHAIELADGRKVLLSVNAAPIFDGAGQVENIVIMVNDVTGQVRASEELWESESRYRRLFEDSPIALWEGDFSKVKEYIDKLVRDTETDLITRVRESPELFDSLIKMVGLIDANTATLNLFNAESARELRAGLHTTIGINNQSVFMDGLAILASGADHYESDAVVITLSGERRSVQMKWSIPRGYENTWARILVSLVDITERLFAEAERGRLLAQVREIMNSVPEGVLLLDSGGRIILVNPAGAEALYVLSGIQVGDKIEYLGDRVLTDLLTSPPKGLWHEVQVDDRIFEVVARPMVNGGEAEHWVLVLRDVTQERQIQEGVHRQERLAAVGQLAAGIAHDFNNILAVIVLYCELILATPGLKPRVHEQLLTMSEQAQRAADLIQQILDFSRRSVLERRPMDMLPFIKEQTKLLRRTLPEDIRIQLDCEIDEYIVSADPTRMQQALMNLAVNARDAMPKGGRLRIGLTKCQAVDMVPCISCGEVLGGDWVCVSFEDSGCGMEKKVEAHIFDPFFTTKDPGQGTGLGLSQVYGIIKQHDGHIGLRTKPGEGSTFFMYIPILHLARHLLLDIDHMEMARGKGEKILVVEDETASRQALVDSLVLLGYDVHPVENGRLALDILEAGDRQVDLVLSDVVMPELGGIALFHAMRARGHPQPLILMTGHPLQEELEELQTLGLASWILKPPRLRQIANIVAQTLS